MNETTEDDQADFDVENNDFDKDNDVVDSRQINDDGEDTYVKRKIPRIIRYRNYKTTDTFNSFT